MDMQLLVLLPAPPAPVVFPSHVHQTIVAANRPKAPGSLAINTPALMIPSMPDDIDLLPEAEQRLEKFILNASALRRRPEQENWMS